MLGAQFPVRTFSGFKTLKTTDQGNYPTCRLISPQKNTPPSPSCSFQFSVMRIRCRFQCPRSISVSCKASSDSSGSTNAHNNNNDDDGLDYLPASLLVSETISHYRMRKQGFQEEVRWHSSGKLVFPFGLQERKEARPNTGLLGHGFLRGFQSPTIFLKVSCDGDFVLPIIVGEFAIEKLIDGIQGDDNAVCADQFQLVGNVAEELGYDVKMVRITERVANTYFARLCFSKPGEKDILSVDARPSDAINVASRCKVPIYISKQIVLTDAIRIGYGVGRVCNSKPIYDVSLDSAADGPDSLVEELDLVRNMNLAVKEERYTDAAMWRDKLMELRKSRQEH
ncbi:PREDICTED: bifunctional nuclease 2 [Populus euphratica]|uniref:Bifunctional nuclease 2 n=1 Tax=Populus euphratica TaxID=75702 RepID=A0AAJ6U457_POPEU|nr:PREDICTED: bifunctional nuclease 2 [Populus euphratica]XP_011022232.1 PREDICTED: bifunctional nuclease 2 [Populus euphratica]